jgi:hypothetical protein
LEGYLRACFGLYLGAYLEEYLRVYLEVYLRVYSEVYLRAYSEVYWGEFSESTGEHLESVFGSVSQAGWECAIERSQECTAEYSCVHAMRCIWQLGFEFVECSMMYNIKCT